MTITQIETDIVREQYEAVEYWTRFIASSHGRFDFQWAMVRPDSKVVPLGTEYRADLFMTCRDASIEIKEMKSSVAEVKVDPASKMGEIKFTATAQPFEFDPKTNLAEKKYRASIVVPTVWGSDTAHAVEESYFVSRPTVQIRSENAAALYAGCANQLHIGIPEFGYDYQPVFSSTDGQIIKTGDVGEIIFVPKPGISKAQITVASTGYRETFQFTVIQPPKPQVKIFEKQGTGFVPLQDPLAVSCRKGRFIIKVVADEGFAKLYPTDVRYEVTQYEASLYSGRKRVHRIKVDGSQVLGLAPLCQMARVGRQVKIEIKSVHRVSFQGKREKIELPRTVFFFNLDT